MSGKKQYFEALRSDDIDDILKVVFDPSAFATEEKLTNYKYVTSITC